MDWETEYHKLTIRYMDIQISCQAELRAMDQEAVTVALAAEKYRSAFMFSFIAAIGSTIAFIIKLFMGG